MNVIKNGFLVLPEGVFCGDLVLDGEKIVQVGGTYEARTDDNVIDVTGKYVFPVSKLSAVQSIPVQHCMCV